MSGWRGQSLECMPTPIDAARTSCSANRDCAGVENDPRAGYNGSMYLPYAGSKGTEYLAVQPCSLENTGNPFVLSVADAITVSGLILAVWAVAYVARMMVRPLFDRDTE